MATVKVSAKYQVVIPDEVRKKLSVRPGQHFEVWTDGKVIKLVRVRPIDEFLGAFPGIDTSVPREDDRV